MMIIKNLRLLFTEDVHAALNQLGNSYIDLSRELTAVTNSLMTTKQQVAECRALIANLQAQLNDVSGRLDNAISKLENVASGLDKNVTVTAYLVRDIGDLKHDAEHRAQSDKERATRTETPITISINADGVPVQIKE